VHKKARNIVLTNVEIFKSKHYNLWAMRSKINSSIYIAKLGQQHEAKER